ncbi:hypothetical protein Pmani_020240 [Petrolisthes manimaculis]|uniref:Uncharacterized protein n=1 Tax=Petrolisthes manimaculis TaxID=1843537 RepID=A0AAE1PI45_9EUCA|nr:hypothetical protein Pmani_020240 [Petrolisthes manimaculis]
MSGANSAASQTVATQLECPNPTLSPRRHSCKKRKQEWGKRGKEVNVKEGDGMGGKKKLGDNDGREMGHTTKGTTM